jgi:AraC family transcriptional regulator
VEQEEINMSIIAKPIVIDGTQNDSLSRLFPKPPLFSSQELRWEGICVQYHRQPAWETPHVCGLHHSIVVHSEPIQTERLIDNRRQHEQISKGDIVIIPAGTQSQQSWNKEVDFSLLLLEPAHIAQIAHESIDVERFEILPHFATPDPLIYQICLALSSEIASGGLCSHLYVDSLVTTLFVRLLRQYSAREQFIREYTDGLSKRKLQQVSEYIDDHLEKNLSLKELAAVVNMSSHYFTSLFKQSTGLSAYQYVIHRRMERAKQLLCRQSLSIIEVSQQVGFQSQSHFSNVFRKYVGTTPRIYREDKK